MNVGFIEGGGNWTTAIVHYDPAQPWPQPLVDVASGFCLEIATAAATAGTAMLGLPDGTTRTTQTPLTAAQMAALGFHTREDVASLTAQ